MGMETPKPALVFVTASLPFAESGQELTVNGQQYEVLFMFQRPDGRFQHILLPR